MSAISAIKDDAEGPKEVFDKNEQSVFVEAKNIVLDR